MIIQRKIIYFLVFLLLVRSTRGTILRLPECNKYYGNWTHIYKGKRLAGSVHTHVESTNAHQCTLKCMLYSKCRSVSVKDDGTSCMLHHSRHEDKGTTFEKKNGWTHVETADDIRNFGPYCRKNEPCKCGKCTDTCGERQYECDRDGHWRLQASSVCFGAKDDSFGEFEMINGGKLAYLKLQHTGEEASLNCAPNQFQGSVGSKWGCRKHPNRIYVAITKQNNEIIMPNSKITWEGMELSGFNGDSPYIVFKGSDITVSAAQMFRIWYTQDLKKTAERDNIGRSCADVFAVICD